MRGNAVQDAPSEDLEALRRALESRTAEAEWLKARYGKALEAAHDRIAELERQLRDASEQPLGCGGGVSSLPMQEIERELERLSQAEWRYLDRIDELKEMLRLRTA